MSKLPTASKKVLRVVMNRGMVRGRDLKRFAGLSTDQELQAALDPLAKGKFVTIQGGGGGMGGAPPAAEAYVAPLPSRRAEAEDELASEDL